MPDVPDGSVLVHVHIPRSGGTSISHWLRLAALNGLTGGHAALYPSRVFRSDDELAAAGLADPRVSTVSTHDIRLFPPRLCGRPARYFTVVREPYAHFASFVRYTMANREHFRVPRGFTRAADVARWLIDARFGELGSENVQTNHLALYPWCALTQFHCDPDDYALWRGEQHHAYWNARLDVAKDVLRSFLCVLTSERLELGMMLLRRRCAELGIDLLPASDLPFVNATVREPEDETWLDDDSPLAAMIRESLAADMQVYAFAERLFHEQLLAAFGDVAAALIDKSDGMR